MSVPIVRAYVEWRCPNCGKVDRTNGQFDPRAVRLHPCPKLHMLSAPMVPVGTAAKVEAIEREDYVGKELVRLDDRKRPVMSVKTTRDTGQDLVVFAPTAQASGKNVA